MMENPYKGKGLPGEADLASGAVITDPASAEALFARCPKKGMTPLVNAASLAQATGLEALWLKDERARMALGSFKALGAAHAIAKKAMAEGGSLEGVTFCCASAGNHGLSVAAGARAFGAQAVIFLAETVPAAFGARLEGWGARVVRAGADYEASMAAAMARAEKEGWVLLPDSSWPGCTGPARDVMEGYLIMGEESARQVPAAPTHIYLQAGVGGLAAAAAASARRAWGDGPRIVVVEPDAAPALRKAIEAGHFVTSSGPVSAMGRLDCKEASHLALKYLAREADAFLTISEKEGQGAAHDLAAAGFPTTPSGGAGYAGCCKDAPGSDARVLLYLSEGREDA